MERTNSVLQHIWYNTQAFLGMVYYRVVALCRLPSFIIPLLLKCVAAFFLASSFATELFIPFIQYFVTTHNDPYTHFYTIGIINAFPYSTLMLWVLSVPYFFVDLFVGSVHHGVTGLDIFLLRIPLLIADIGVLLILLSWFKKYQKEVIWLYWCSPVLFYITYIHGQLDVLPIFFLFSFLYFLFKELDIAAFIFLGLAISVKTGMLVVFPFVALYLYKERTSLASTISTLTIPVTTYLLLNMFHLHNSAFVEMVLKTKEEFKVFDLTFRYSDTLVVYIIPVVYCILLFKFASYKRYSRDLFMVFFGLTFFVLTLCIPPMQGWYYWVIPFAVYFYTKGNGYQRMLYYAITIAYFLYFAVIPKSDFFDVFKVSSQKIASLHNLYTYGLERGLPVDFFVSLSFTILQALLLLNIYLIYRKGVEQYIRQKIHYQPFLIGVVGDSGSGKTTFAELMHNVFSSRNTTIIAGDDMHKWERGDDNWQKYTHLDPMANELHADIKNVYTIKQGKPITRKHYDHATGKFATPKIYEPRRLVIFEGLHAFFLNKVRKAFDIKVYIAPEDQLRLHWKVLRDVGERGYTKEQVLDTLEKRRDDSERYIAVQEKYSDIIISLRNTTSLGQHLGSKEAQLSLSLFISCANDVFLQPLLDELQPYFSIDYLMYDEKQRVKFFGSISKDDVKMIAEKLLPELDEISVEKRVWEEGYQGVMQLFVTFYMFQSMALEEYEK